MVKTDRFDSSHVYVFEPNGKPIAECRTRQAVKALALTAEDRKLISEGMKHQRAQLKRCYTMLNNATEGLHLLSPADLLALPENFDIVKLGSTKSVKGASHTFSNYKAIDLDTKQPDISKLDFKEDRKEKQAENFNQTAVLRDTEETVHTDAEAMNEFFKIAVQKKTGDDDYEQY